jgi:hypothetical protein
MGDGECEEEIGAGQTQENFGILRRSIALRHVIMDMPGFPFSVQLLGQGGRSSSVAMANFVNISPLFISRSITEASAVE